MSFHSPGLFRGMLIQFIVLVLFYLAWPWMLLGVEMEWIPFFLEAYRWAGHPDAPRVALLLAAFIALAGGFLAARRYGSGWALLFLLMDAALIGGLAAAWPGLLGRGYSQPIALAACYMIWATVLRAPIMAMKWQIRLGQFRRQCRGDLWMQKRQEGYSPAYFFALLAAGAGGVVYALREMFEPAMNGSALGLLTCAGALGGLALLLSAGEEKSRPLLVGRAGILHSNAALPWAKVTKWESASYNPLHIVIHFGGFTYPDKVAFNLTEDEYARFKENVGPLISEAQRARHSRRAGRRAVSGARDFRSDDSASSIGRSPAGRDVAAARPRRPRRDADDFSIRPAAPADPSKKFYDEVL